MSYLNMVRDAGFSGTSNELNALRAAVNAALLEVDALSTRLPSTTPATVRAYLSTANLSGTAAAPVVDLRWMVGPPTPSWPVPIDAVVEASLRANISGVTVRHDGAARTFGTINVTTLGTACAF